MELLDIVDDNNNLTGEKRDRVIVHKEGLRHREVATIVMNENNQILLEKRAATKKQSPNKWGLVAGHISAGEEAIESMVREISEEIGITVCANDLKFLMNIKTDKQYSQTQYNNTFLYVYLLKTNKKVEDYKVQKEELSEVKYFTINELEKAIEEKDSKYSFSKGTYVTEIINKIKEEIL